ncbi:hypothetical protein BC936DRAFT_138633 [Jimgerdemannia flammicorona]|uniref:Uncharacterized protein n=1 Tax=Jimgerdemannia flammicorona TaxID=994334 RepID=A0A433BX38_9FUNG|nr:hypothetical protein BC936DRAFT_138633 [Jimgerdemannia flammicorona]
MQDENEPDNSVPSNFSNSTLATVPSCLPALTIRSTSTSISKVVDTLPPPRLTRSASRGTVRVTEVPSLPKKSFSTGTTALSSSHQSVHADSPAHSTSLKPPATVGLGSPSSSSRSTSIAQTPGQVKGLEEEKGSLNEEIPPLQKSLDDTNILEAELNGQETNLESEIEKMKVSEGDLHTLKDEMQHKDDTIRELKLQLQQLSDHARALETPKDMVENATTLTAKLAAEVDGRMQAEEKLTKMSELCDIVRTESNVKSVESDEKVNILLNKLKKITAKEAENRRLEANLREEAMSKLAGLEKIIQERNIKLQRITVKCSTQEDTIKDLNKQISNLKNEVKDSKHKMARHIKDIAKLQNDAQDVERLRGEAEEHDTVVDKLNAEIMAVQEELGGALADVKERDTAIDELNAHITKLQEELESGRAELEAVSQESNNADLSKNNLAMEAERAEMYSQLAQLREQLATTDAMGGQCRAHIVALQTELDWTNAQLGQQVFRTEELLQERESVFMQAQVVQDKASAEIGRRDEMIRQYQAELAEVLGKFVAAEQAVSELVSRNQTLKEQMHASEEQGREMKKRLEGKMADAQAVWLDDKEAVSVQLAACKARVTELEAEVADKKTVVEQLNTELDETRESHAMTFSDIKMKYEKVVRTNNDLTQRIEEAQSTVELQQSRLARFEEENELQQSRLARFEEENELQQSRLARFEEENAGQMDVLYGSLGELERKLAMRDENARALKERTDKLAGTVARLESELTLESRRAEGLKAERDVAVAALESQRTRLEKHITCLLESKALEEVEYKAGIASAEKTISVLRGEIERIGVAVDPSGLAATQELEARLGEMAEKLQLVEGLYLESKVSVESSRAIIAELESRCDQAHRTVASIEMALFEKLRVAEEHLTKNTEEKNGFIANINDLESTKQELNVLLEMERQRHSARDVEFDALLRDIDNQRVTIERQVTNLKTLCFEFDEKAALLGADSRKDKDTIENLRRDLAEAQSKSKQLEQTIEIRNKRIKHPELDTKDYEITVNEMNATIAKLRGELKTKKELMDEPMVKLENAKRADDQVQQSTDAKAAELQALTTEMKALRSHKEYQDRRAAEYELTVQGLRDEVERVRNKPVTVIMNENMVLRVRDLEKAVEERVDEIVELKAKMAEVVEVKQALERDKSQLEKSVQGGDKNTEVSESEMDALKVEVDELKHDKQRLQTKLDAAESSLKELDVEEINGKQKIQDTVQTLEQTINSLRNTVQVKEIKIAQLEANINANLQVLDERTKIITQLEENVAELEKTATLEESLQTNTTEHEQMDDKCTPVLKESKLSKKLKDKLELYKRQNEVLQVKFQEKQETLGVQTSPASSGYVFSPAQERNTRGSSSSLKSNPNKRPLSVSTDDITNDSPKRQMADKAATSTQGTFNASLASEDVVERTIRSSVKDTPTSKTIGKKFVADVASKPVAASPLQEVTNTRGVLSSPDRRKTTLKESGENVSFSIGTGDNTTARGRTSRRLFGATRRISEN